MSERSITVNGVSYDSESGLPHDHANASVHKGHAHTHAHAVHTKMQRSQTLQRQMLKKPHAKPSALGVKSRPIRVQKSPHISKFAPNPQPLPKQSRGHMDIRPATKHPHVVKAHATVAQKAQAAHHTPSAHTPAAQLKHQAIQKALANAAPSSTVKQRSNHLRRINIASASLAMLLLAGYLTYINLPALSVRVAAAQAGIDASYPEYRPNGYSLAGPVAYSGGEVSMKFRSNSGPQKFSIQQARSTWDSTALLSNYVEQKASDDYTTFNDAGLTIYTYGSNAAWVNGGILYTIEGDAPLSNDQIRHIATSM